MSAAEGLARVREGNNLSLALEVLRRRWIVVVAAIVICTGFAALEQKHSAKTYKATASVAFQSSTLSESALGVGSSGSSEPQREADTQVTIAHSPEVATAVKAKLGGRVSVQQLLSEVSVEAAPNADVLEITAQTGSPAYSAQLANLFATQYIEFRRNVQLASIDEARRQFQKQLAALPAGSPEAPALQSSLQRLTQLSAVVGADATIVGRAMPPSSPANMKLSTALVIGLLVGLGLAFTLVFVLESLDRSVKTVEEFEREYRASALTVVPQSNMRPARANERSELLEPYRILRSALEFAAVARPVDTLLVTSAMPGEGKTTVSVDLAHAVALTHRRVVLIELDLRMPTFARHFGLSTRSGLTAALLGEKSPSELLVKPLPELPNLSVLPAGRLPHNPSELIASSILPDIIFDLAEEDVMVIVDAPPLNPVADTQTLLASSTLDATLLVARLDNTDRREVRRARAILDRHMVDPLGLVITGARDAKPYVYVAQEETLPPPSERTADNGRRRPPRPAKTPADRSKAPADRSKAPESRRQAADARRRKQGEERAKAPDAPKRLSV
jgi:tyrosine-protein kinase